MEQAVLHQGRTRTFPHVVGNYATHVFIAGLPWDVLLEYCTSGRCWCVQWDV